MTLTSIGKVVVPTPGTPVALTTDGTIRVSRVILQAAPANTGKTYFGQTGLSIAALSGVSRVLAATENYEISTEDGTDGIVLSQLSIDADIAGEGLLISYWTE